MKNINNYKKYITEIDYNLYYFHTKDLKDKNNPLLNIYPHKCIY